MISLKAFKRKELRKLKAKHYYNFTFLLLIHCKTSGDNLANPLGVFAHFGFDEKLAIPTCVYLHTSYNPF